MKLCSIADKRLKLSLIFLFFSFFFLSSCTSLVMVQSTLIPSFPDGHPTDFKEKINEYEKTWGIRPESIRYSAGGYMLDFRFRILDPDKAVPLLDPQVKPYLLDEKSQRRFFVPAPAKTGALRQTTKAGKPLAGRVYFIIFANPGKFIKQGDAVTVIIGDFKAGGLQVQ